MFYLFLDLTALQEINLSHNRLRSLQNRTNGLFEDVLSIKSVIILFHHEQVHKETRIKLFFKPINLYGIPKLEVVLKAINLSIYQFLLLIIWLLARKWLKFLNIFVA